MKRIFNLLTASMMVLAFLATPNSAKASHEMGFDLTYECINNCTIRVHLSAYRNCNGSNIIGNNVNFVAQTPGCALPQPIGGWSAQVTTEVTPVCPGIPTQCNTPGAAIEGVQEFYWYRDYNICNSPNCIFTITWSDCCRNPSITSLTNAGGQGIAGSSTTLNTGIQPCNSSPQFANPPVPYLCQGQPYTFNQGAFDPEGDQLSYSLGPCYQTLPSTQVNYAPGFSMLQPLGPSWNVQINSQTGDVTVTPQPGNTVVAVLCVYVNEIRNGQIINTIVRDIQMTVIPCPNNVVPNSPGITNVTGAAVAGPFAVTMCAGNTLTFELPIVDPDAGQTHITYWNGGIPGATFSNAAGTQFDTLSGPTPTAIFTWTPTATGTYSFLVTTRDNACPIPGQNQFTIVIDVIGGLPGAGITATPTGCTNVSLNANPGTGNTGPYTYQWSGDGNLNINPNNTQQTLTHVYPGPGTYNVSVQITDNFGCSTTLTSQVVIPNGPTSDAGPDISICSGLSVQLGSNSLPPGQTYNWFPATGLSATNVPNPTFNFTLPGNTPQTFNYTVSATSGFCTSVDYVTVVVYPIPTANITGNVNICNGQSTTLTATGGTSFLWSTGETTASITVSPTSTTTYSVITNGNGCSSLPTQVTVNVSNGPNVIITGVDSVCSGGSTVLTAAGGSSWLWSTGATTQSITLNNITTQTTVSVVASQNGCPGPAATYTVELHASPSADFANSTVCEGNITTFQDLSSIPIGGPTGVVSWNWSFGDPLSLSNNSSQLQNPTHEFTAAGTYNVTLTVEGYNGCTNTITKQVIVNPLPTADFNFEDACDGETVTFTDISNPAGAPIQSWSWDFGSGQTSNQQNPTNVFPAPGLYNVTLSVTNANGCSDQTTKTIIIFPNPVAEFSFEHFCWNSITQFTSHSFVNDPNGTTLDLHEWNFGDPSTGASNTSNEVDPIHNFSRPGTFFVTLTVTTSRGCSHTIVVPVNVPEVSLPVPTHDTICYGEQGSVYMWNPDPTIGTLEWFYTPDGVDPFLVGTSSYTTPPLTGDTYYFVGLRDEDGCLSPKIPVAVYVKPEPNIHFNVNSQVLDIPSAIAEFTVTQEFYGPIVSYLWDFGDGSVSSEINPVHQYNEEGTYDITIHLVNDYGCETTINLPLYIKVNKLVRIFVPSAFTPNNDGRNDYFEVFTTLITDFHIDIFDRWGKLVYASDDMGFKWSGDGLPEDAYTYVINAVEWSGEKVRKVGTITIIR